MRDLGEPWLMFHREYERAVACANALAGISDPAAFVERAKAMEVSLRIGRDMGSRACATTLAATPADIAALAAEWTEGESHHRTVAEAIYGSENGR